MLEYHKINSVFKRDPNNQHKTFIMGDYSVPEFELLKNVEWVFTEKVDGTNIRVHWDGKKVTFGGRTENAQIPATLIEVLQTRFPAERMLNAFGDRGGIILYGEGFGNKIQSGVRYLPHPDFVLFDISSDDGVYFQRHDLCTMANLQLDVPYVPEIGRGTLSQAIDMVSAGFTSTWGNFPAEGLVMRPAIELKTRMGERVITKLKHKDFASLRAAA